MDIKIVDNEGIEKKQENKSVEIKDAPVQVDGASILQPVVADLFDLSPKEQVQFKGKINTLIDYAKSQTDDHSVAGIKWVLRNLALKVGTPPLGEKMINYLTTYAHLAGERKRIDNQIEQYERA